MRRISQSFDLSSRARTRRNFAAAAFAVVASALLVGTQAGFACNVGEARAENSPLYFDVGCAQSDLDVVTLIERNGNSGLSTTATLVEASEFLQTARSACEVGDIDNALALYDTALRRLENPSDIARR
jgi:hypothetical protein